MMRFFELQNLEPPIRHILLNWVLQFVTSILQNHAIFGGELKF